MSLGDTWQSIREGASQAFVKAVGAILDHKWISLGSTVAAAGLVTVLVLAPWKALAKPTAPDPNTQSPEQIAQFMASDRFASLPPETKNRYLERIRQIGQDRGRRALPTDNLSDEQRRKLRENMRNAWEQQMDDRMKQFFELSPEKRTAYLDQMIDRMQQRMRDRGNRPDRPDGPRSRPAGGSARARPDSTNRTNAAGNTPNGQRGSGRGRRRFDPSRMKDRIESTSPEQKARRAEFRKALRKRMEERGITFGGRRGR